MQISEQLVLLAELSNHDQKLKATNDRLEVVPAPAKKLQAAAAALGAQLEAAKNKKAEAEKQRRLADSELTAERAKLKKWEARADSLRGEREHAALASEIGAQKRTLGNLEERVLQQLQNMEDADKEIASLEARFKVADGDARSEWAKVEGELTELRATAEKTNAARQALLAKLPPNVVKQYERVAAKRQGVGVAIIKGEVCNSCKRTLPPQLCLQVHKGVVLESCPSCSRLLVHESFTAAQSQDATA